MYVPASFAETDLPTLHELMRRHDFATLVTVADGVPTASHLPFLLEAGDTEKGTLLGHVARANPQWRGFADSAALVVFSGPHAYVSPTWYAAGHNVPTWNYAVVHAYGRARVIEDAEEARSVIRRLVDRHEGGRPDAWSMESVPDDFVSRLLAAIVVFEIPIERLEGKFKLNQNKKPEDRAGVVANLRRQGGPEATALADLMASRG